MNNACPISGGIDEGRYKIVTVCYNFIETDGMEPWGKSGAQEIVRPLCWLWGGADE